MTKLEGLNDDFRAVLGAFADARVEFLIVGAYALGFHGAPRAAGRPKDLADASRLEKKKP